MLNKGRDIEDTEYKTYKEEVKSVFKLLAEFSKKILYKSLFSLLECTLKCFCIFKASFLITLYIQF